MIKTRRFFNILFCLVSLLACPFVAKAETSTSNPTTSMSSNSPSVIDEQSLNADPMISASAWLQEAQKKNIAPSYVMLASWMEKFPNIKIMTLGKVTAEGYTFFTNEESHAAKQLTKNPYAAVAITWKDGSVQRQLRMLGKVSPVGPITSQAIDYQGKKIQFKSRSYVLKPEKVQFSFINFQFSDKLGVAEFVNYKLKHGAWNKDSKKILPFVLSGQ